MRFLKKTLCILLCGSVLCVSMVSAADAFAASDVDYIIANPYADVDWSAAKQYKTALHTHTNASDGDITLRESLETHLLQGFDIVATTDHGIVNKGWARAEDSDYAFIHSMLRMLKRTEGDLDYLGEQGTFTADRYADARSFLTASGMYSENGYAYTLRKTDGDEHLIVAVPTGERDILRVPYGIENNALSINAHVNGWFADYHDNSVTDYGDALCGVTKAGGVCVINHPGEYTKAKSDLTSAEAYDENNWAYRYYINRYYDLLRRYPACIGIDVNSKGDSRTRYDRELWDILLRRSTPGGRNIFAICSSDAHQADKINTGYTRLLMTEKTSAAARRALESGAFFGCSYCNGNREELANILEYLEEYYGTESAVYASVAQTVAAMDRRTADVQSGAEKPGKGPADPMRLVDENGFFHGKDTFITSIAVDNDADTITVRTEHALLVRWISDGEVIAVSKAQDGESTLVLDQYSDRIGTYVRAEAFGEGGTVYTNPFVLSYSGQPTQQSYPYLPFPILDALFAEVRTFFVKTERSLQNMFRR